MSLDRLDEVFALGGHHLRLTGEFLEDLREPARTLTAIAQHPGEPFLGRDEILPARSIVMSP